MKKETKDLITQAEAARLRGVTIAAIADLVRRDRLTVVEIAGRRFVRQSEVVNFQKLKPTGRPKKTKAATQAKKSPVAAQRKTRATEKKGSKKASK